MGMKKVLLGCVVVVCFIGQLNASKKVLKTSVFFETDKHELSEEGKRELHQFIKENVKGLDYELLVQGHADKRGDLIYNDALSLRRANRVRELITTKGISSKLIELSHYGERNPNGNSNSKNHLSQNRRVDVILHIYEFNSVEEIQAALKENSVSEFEINPELKNLLKGKNGTKVLIEPNSFVDEMGKPISEKVEVVMDEAIKLEDWVANDLSTESNGKLLVSGGMMKISAKTMSGKEVRLDATKPLLVALPNSANQLDDKMEMFTSSTGGNWSAVGNRPLNLSGIEMRPFPKRKHAPLNYTNYTVDYSTKPRRPMMLYKPTEPHKPREMDMRWNVHWYTINKNKKEEKNIAAYHKNLDSYYKRMERFKKSDKKYKTSELNHQKDLMTYEEDLKDWFDSVEVIRENWELLPENVKIYRENDSLNKLYSIIHQKKVDEWKEERRDKIGAMAGKMDDIGITNTSALNTYVFTMNTLGWINCDRFYSVPKDQKREIIVQESDTSSKKVLLVLKNLNSSINLQKWKGKYANSQIPKNEEVMLFSFKVIEGKPHVCLKEIELGNNNVKMDFRPSSFAEIKEILAGFKRG